MTTAPGPAGPSLVPITVLTGFLGAGKTTLLNALLRESALADSAVIVNEFGDIGIDHLLVDNVDGDMLVLTTGCICCAARGDLTEALENLIERRRAGSVAFDRIIIETTGIADPGPILNSVLVHGSLWRTCRMGAVITVVDALGGAALLEQRTEAARQVAVADAIVLSKTDCLPPNGEAAQTELELALRALNPTAPILSAQDVGGVLASVLDPAPRLRMAQSSGHDHDAHPHAASFAATCLRAGVIGTGRLQDFVDVLQGRLGPNLLRLKGLVATSDDPARPLVIHAVQHMTHPSQRLPAWPAGELETRLVVITSAAERRVVSELWDAFFGPPSIDRPDASALMHAGNGARGLF